ncbi:Zinc finger MYM-type protein 2 [Exaiptasia diaphana]|nr:Zinc finger MYM-type protein 2 [Exaiptasia diaphana]
MKLLLQKAVPISTRYKNSWAVNIFEEWRQIRENKVASLESTSLNLSLDSIQHLDIEPWETVTVSSLNFWLWKFVQEASDKKGSPYPARTLYQLIASLKRHLESKNRTDVNMLDKSNMSFSGLRKILDAEMKSVHSKGVTNRKKEKELITDEEEEAMWRKGVLGQSTAEILLKTVYFYNGKLFGIRSQEHRQLRISDIEIEGDEHIIYRENSSKTFHGGIADLN